MTARPDLDALIEALESPLDTIRNYYDRKTGEIVMISEEFGEGPADIETNTERYLPVLPLSSNERFQIMEDFIDSLSDEVLQEELNTALIEKGAFQRFEAVLRRHPREWEQWRRFRNDKVTLHALEWLRANGVEA